MQNFFLTLAHHTLPYALLHPPAFVDASSCPRRSSCSTHTVCLLEGSTCTVTAGSCVSGFGPAVKWLQVGITQPQHSEAVLACSNAGAMRQHSRCHQGFEHPRGEDMLDNLVRAQADRAAAAAVAASAASAAAAAAPADANDRSLLPCTSSSCRVPSLQTSSPNAGALLLLLLLLLLVLLLLLLLLLDPIGKTATHLPALAPAAVCPRCRHPPATQGPGTPHLPAHASPCPLGQL